MRSRAVVAAAGLVALAALASCRRGQDAPPAAVDAAVGSAAASVAPPVVASRCHAAAGGAALASPVELEVGDATAFGEGYAVGLVHRTAAGRAAAVALVDREIGTARVIDLGTTLGDAPPPRLARRGGELLVASYALPGAPGRPGGPKSGDTRELALRVLLPSGDARPLASLLQQRDDSLAFDLAAGLVVWDESASGSIPRGVVRVAEVAADHAGAPRDASPPDSDAEMPRVLPAGAGYVVFWVARRPEAAHVPDAAAPVVEAVGEPRAFSWLEMVTVDGAGAPVGSVRKLTSPSGHVSAYDVAPLAGEGRPTLLVVARDDGEAVDGSGGVLLRVRVRDDGADPPLAMPGDGLGRGAPQLIEATAAMPGWLSWIGPHEELRLLPLDVAGVPVAPPSAEPTLDDALPLAVIPGRLAGEDRMLVAFPPPAAPGETRPEPPREPREAPELRVVDCAR